MREASQSAKVETLTAEVKTLQVGNRQVTLSVYRQLDEVGPLEIEPFGRVHDKSQRGLWVVGRSASGELVKSKADPACDRPWLNIGAWIVAGSEARSEQLCDLGIEGVEAGFLVNDDVERSQKPFGWAWKSEEDRALALSRAQDLAGVWKQTRAVSKEWVSLPLIVLAGLR